eukprot:CAMPEP_0202963998 /NCGR_PEP_ID=MMETSP1396-20130829/8066_1 /ASSEMBLY_ACC=CAM_ASM_000872 /TAXON_ID= /ORGANISM="Pseudokeronopsis sp., Strain Brazil" /LENGTH=305 /DNA_ID=CAMNT_0049685737 /DNA_START=131 /DNA_END=1048 /DNA_ORIENTATION=+
MFFVATPKLGLIIWPKVVGMMQEYHISKFQGYAWISFLFSWTVHLISNLVMWLIYHLELPFFERYKITSEPWPWYANNEEWRKLMWKSIAYVTANNIIFTPLLVYVGGYFLNYKVDMSFEVEDLPSTMTMLMTIPFCMLIEDFAFHHTHKFLHRPYFYKRIHKIHHEHIETVAIASEATHPIEYLFGNSIPLVLGPILLGKKIHVWTYIMWMFVRLLETVDGHSGYEFSWSPFRILPFASSSQYHAYHHTHNVGNYSSFFSIWDTFYGTNKTFYEYIAGEKKIVEQLQKQQEKKNSKGKKKKNSK